MDILSYDLLEDAIVNRLFPLVSTGIEVEPLPESPALSSTPFEKPRITVAYKSSDYDDTVTRGLPSHLTSGQLGQNEYAEIELIIRTRLMRGPRGAHAVKKAIDFLLVGFHVPGWDKLFPKQYTIIPNQQDIEDGIWTYSYTFVTKCILVEAEMEDVIVLLQQIDFNTSIIAPT